MTLDLRSEPPAAQPPAPTRPRVAQPGGSQVVSEVLGPRELPQTARGRRLERALARAVAQRAAPPSAGPVLARTMTAAVPKMDHFTAQHGATPAALSAMGAELTRAWSDMKLDEVQVSYVDDKDSVDALFVAYATALSGLTAAIGTAAPGIDASTYDLKTAGVSVKTAAKAVTDELGKIWKAVNGAFNAHAKATAASAASATPVEEPDYASFERMRKAKRSQGGAAAVVEEGAVGGGTKFPHGGKHQPPPGWVDDAKILEEKTEGKGKVALYKSNIPATVIAWEQAAIDHGLTLMDDFTIVYAFDEWIGADQGEATRFIRMEGHHHGHPIIETKGGYNAAFDSYLSKEVAEAKKKADNVRLRQIADFLAQVKVPPSRYKLDPAKIPA